MKSSNTSVDILQSHGPVSAPKNERSGISPNLSKMLAAEEQIRERKKQSLQDDQPLLMLGEKKIIFPGTIVTIQGKQGSHKSRLASAICSALLKDGSCDKPGLELERCRDAVSVIYVDTERSLSTQFPMAIQGIQVNACFSTGEDPPHLSYSSLLGIPRKERFKTLREYIAHKRKGNADHHIVVILDVFSDCVVDFNNPQDSMKVIDYANMLINEHNCTVVAVIHENPGSVKARGHLGTELGNKSTTVLQTAIDGPDDQQYVKISFVKCRNTELYKPIYCRYSEETGSLVVLAPGEEPDFDIRNASKAPAKSVAVYLPEILKHPMLRGDLMSKLSVKFDCSERTLESRLKTIRDEKIPIQDASGNKYTIHTEQKADGYFYSLLRVTEEASASANPI